MVVFMDMMFIGVCVTRWSPVVSARSLRFVSMLISSDVEDGILTSVPLVSVIAIAIARRSDRLITCN